MNTANTTNGQEKYDVFHEDDGRDEEVDQDVSMAIKYNTSNHQDEDEPIQR